MTLRIVFIITTVLFLLVPGPLPAQKSDLWIGDIYKTAMFLEGELQTNLQNTLTTIRNSSASGSEKQTLINKAVEEYKVESQKVKEHYRDVATEQVNQLASDTGMLTDKDGNKIPAKEDGPSAPIPSLKDPSSSAPKTGPPPSPPDPGRGMLSDVDTTGGTKTVSKIPGILDQTGLTGGDNPITTSGPNADVIITPGYITIKGLNLTVFTPSSAIGTAMGPPGSTAHETQVAVDAASHETYLSVSMSKDQPGMKYVAVMDNTKKANEGLKVSPDTLINFTDAITNQSLQNLAKGTMKSADVLYGANMDTKLAEILTNNNIQIPGIPPEKYGELLVKLKTGSAIAPDGVGLTPENIDAFQQACKTALDQIQAEAKQTADLEMEIINNQIKAMEATGDPADKAEAQKLREKKVDSQVKIEQSEKFNKPYTKPPTGPGDGPEPGKSTAGGAGKGDGPGVTQDGPRVKDGDDPPSKTTGTGKAGDPPDSKTTVVKKGDPPDGKKPGGPPEPGDSGGIPLPKAPVAPDVTVKFFEKFFEKGTALYTDTKTGGIVTKDGTIGASKVETQIGQAGMKSQFEVTADEEGAKLTVIQEYEANLIKIQTMTTMGNETVTGTVTTEGKVGTKASFNLNAYTSPLGMGSSGGFDVFAGAKGSISGSLLLDLKQWLGVSLEGTVSGEAGVGAGAKGYYNVELSWSGVKAKGGAAGYTGVGGGVNTGINIDASPLVFGVDLAQADQDGAKSDILQTILHLVKNNVIQLPEGKKFSDLAQDINTYSKAVIKQPNVIPTGKNGKPVLTPAEFVINKIGFKPPVPVVPGVKPPPPDPDVLAMKAADLKQEAWEKAVLSGKLKPDEYQKFLVGYDPKSRAYKTEAISKKPATGDDFPGSGLIGEKDINLGGTSDRFGGGQLYGRPDGSVYVVYKDGHSREYKTYGPWQTDPSHKHHAKDQPVKGESGGKGPVTGKEDEKERLARYFREAVKETKKIAPPESGEPFDKEILTIVPGEGSGGKVIEEKTVPIPGGGQTPASRTGQQGSDYSARLREALAAPGGEQAKLSRSRQEALGREVDYEQRLKGELKKISPDPGSGTTSQSGDYSARLKEALAETPKSPPPGSREPYGDNQRRAHLGIPTAPSPAVPTPSTPTVTQRPASKPIEGNPLAGTYRGTLALTLQFTDARMAKAAGMAGINMNPREAVTITVDNNGAITLKTSGGSFPGTMQGNRFTIPITMAQAAYTIQGQINGNSLTATGTGGERSGRAKGTISLTASK